MPVPKPLQTLKVTPALRAPGVAILIRYGAQLSPPKPEEALPGIRCTQYRGQSDAVLIEAVGYEARVDAADAIVKAAQACIDAGLRVSFAPAGHRGVGPARIVRREAAQ